MAMCLGAVLVGMAGCNDDEIKMKTEYQVLTLDNGSVFFGKIGEVKSHYLLLKDVHFAQQQVSEDKKEVKIKIIRRSDDLNNPDYMQINTRHIVLIEPLNPASKLGKLIQNDKETHPAATPFEQPPKK